MIKIGDTVLLKGTAFTVQEFPSKLGAPDGAFYEATREMDADDETAWEADTLAVLTRQFVAEHGRDPAESEALVLAARAKLRPTLTIQPRDGGASFQRPRLKRLTGLVADLDKISDGLFQVKGA